MFGSISGNAVSNVAFRDLTELCREVLDDFGPLWGRDTRAFFRTHGDREYGPGRIRLKHLGFAARPVLG